MDTIERIQLLNDVLSGKRVSELKAELDDPSWLPTALEFIVAERLKKTTIAVSQFRLKIAEMVAGDGVERVEATVTGLDNVPYKVNANVIPPKEKVTYTDWQPEYTRMHAPMAMAQVRQQHRTAKISVERQ